LLAASIVMLMNLLADVLYTLMNPRVRAATLGRA